MEDIQRKMKQQKKERKKERRVKRKNERKNQSINVQVKKEKEWKKTEWMERNKEMKIIWKKCSRILEMI